MEKRLEQIADIAAMSKEDRMKYDERIKVYRDRLGIMEFERLKGCAEGLAEARAEGRAEDFVEGFVEGFVAGFIEGFMKGRAEANLHVVRNLKQMGLAPEFIAQATGLSVGEVERMMNEAD